MPTNKFEGMIAFRYFILYACSGCRILDKTGQDFLINLEFLASSTLMDLRRMKLVLRDPTTSLTLEDSQHVLKKTNEWTSEKFIAEEGPKNPLKQIEYAQNILKTYKRDRFLDYLRERGYYTDFDGNDMKEMGLICFDWDE